MGNGDGNGKGGSGRKQAVVSSSGFESPQAAANDTGRFSAFEKEETLHAVESSLKKTKQTGKFKLNQHFTNSNADTNKSPVYTKSVGSFKQI